LDRRLESPEIRVLQLRTAAESFTVAFVEPVEPNGVKDLPEWSPVAKDPDERSFAGGAVHHERNSHESSVANSSVTEPQVLMLG
jgi:hypothetical protein